MKSNKKLFKVTFLSQGKALELYAHHVASSALWGFTEVGDIVFDQQQEALVIDPTEERLRGNSATRAYSTCRSSASCAWKRCRNASRW